LERKKVKKQRQKTLMIIAIVSIFLCGCPGCFTLFQGFRYFSAAIGSIQSFGDLMRDIGAGFLNGGWQVCLSGFFILIPFILVIVAVIQRGKKAEDFEDLAPTGVSDDHPIPPPS
jgi:hypothetical protein